MSEINTVPEGLANRLTNWWRFGELRTEFFKSNYRHAGRFYASQLSLSAYQHEILISLEYEDEAAQYVIDHCCAREIDDIIESYKKLGTEFKQVSGNEYQLGNYTIIRKHCDNKIIQKIPLFEDTFVIEEYYARTDEDTFFFVHDAVSKK